MVIILLEFHWDNYDVLFVHMLDNMERQGVVVACGLVVNYVGVGLVKYANQLLIQSVVCIVIFAPDAKDFGVLEDYLAGYGNGGSRGGDRHGAGIDGKSKGCDHQCSVGGRRDDKSKEAMGAATKFLLYGFGIGIKFLLN